ncbi:MAG: DUF2971 domain-containing protein [Janthinobacterium lividum]
MAAQYGLLCFSLGWQNPLQWSHYADRHRGIALGFDIDEALLRKVSYQRSRRLFNELSEVNESTMRELLFTKYVGWSYEKEVRVYTRLDTQDAESGLYFADFGDQLALREVIAGPMSKVPESELREAAGSTENVAFLKARLAFRSFRVVANRRGFPVKGKG